MSRDEAISRLKTKIASKTEARNRRLQRIGEEACNHDHNGDHTDQVVGMQTKDEDCKEVKKLKAELIVLQDHLTVLTAGAEVSCACGKALPYERVVNGLVVCIDCARAKEAKKSSLR